MKSPTYLLLAVLFFVPSLACRAASQESTQGSGRIISETVEIHNFDGVSLDGSGEVYIEQGPTERLTIEADDNILPLLDTRVRGDELVLGIKLFQDIHPSQPIIYRLTVRDLNKLTLNGSGDFLVDTLEVKDLKISILGSGSVHVENLIGKLLALDLRGSGNIALDDVNVKTVEASIPGSGDIKLHGKAKNQEVSIGGSGNYLAGDFETLISEIKVPGSGDLTIWVTKDLRVRVNGDGTIHYYGHPSIDQSGFGSGKLISMGEK